jgi:hypothetical protein
MRIIALAAAAAGCFRPSPPAGDPCGPNDWCPPPQTCIASVCAGATGDAPVGAGPRAVAASPGPAPMLDQMTFNWCNAYGVAVPLIIGADDPSATIYYTTDGTMPTPSSPSGKTPVTIPATSTSFAVSYFARTAGSTAIATDTFVLKVGDTHCQQQTWGFLVTDTKLDGTSPVVDATPGQQLHATASYQVWTNGCVGCGTQLVYGIDQTPQGCLFDESGQAYPGATGPTSFTVTAPTMPGVYDVMLRLVFDNNCNMAKADITSPTWEPRKVRIGVVVVR